MGKRNYQQAYKEFLSRLQQARESAGLSQEEAGQRLKRNQSFISRCESGARMVSVAEAFEFADVYQVTIHDLLK